MSLYRHLDPDDIRLLTISVHNGAIKSLALHSYARTATPEYDAISYTWGNDTSTISVMCNETPLEIQTNLFRALPFIHDFRPEPKTRPLWVDAICLNQDDREEKAVHVPQMGEVYENAARTLIWLGEAGNNSDLAMDNIENLTQKMLTVDNADTLPLAQKLIKYDLPPCDDQIWESIKVLQERSWVFRLWTLQEVVLSKQAVVLCGCKSIPWNSLLALHQVATQAKLSILVYAEADPEFPYKQSRMAISHVNFLRQLRWEGNRNRINLSILLTLSADRGYSLTVDRVWALVGMLNKKYQKLIRDEKLVDYSEDAISNYHETFVGIVKFHIKYDTSIAMKIIEDNFRTISNPLLPSWVPDWHTDRGTIPLARWPEAFVGYPGGQNRLIEPFMQVNEDSSLELCGLMVDIVGRVTRSAGQDLMDLKSFPWLIECWDIIKSTPFVQWGDVYPDTATVATVSTTYFDGSPMSEQRQRYQRLEEILRYVLYPPNVLLETSTRTLLRCNGRKFFCTKNKRLGI